MKKFYNVVNSASALIVLSCKIVKNRILPEVCKLTKKHRLIVLFTSDAMHKKYKWLAYTSPDLLARFCKVNLTNTKNPAWFFILASLLDKGMQPINYKCVKLANLLWSRAIMALDSSKVIAIGVHIRLLTRCKIVSLFLDCLQVIFL